MNKQVDIILAADVVYLCDQYEPLLRTLQVLTECGTTPTTLILSHRKRMTHQEEFLGPLESMFQVEETIPVHEVMPDYPKPTQFILICKRRPPTTTPATTTTTAGAETSTTAAAE
eukprot:PhF_6_TR456/c0_g1_i1/m.182